MSDNFVTIIGNVTRDPELRYTADGMAVVNFGVAVNKRKLVNGEWVDGDTSFFNCAGFRDTAENIAHSLVKGTRVIIIGTLKYRTWETDEGDKRSTVEIIVDEAGPSLRWATASVDKTNRDKTTPPPTPAPTHRDPIYDNEPPF